MKRLLVLLILCTALTSSRVGAQSFSYDQITSFSYEDVSDLLRRFPGMYPMDYGVLGAPMIIRPWGLSPWLIGAERDGIPWNRVSDGLWNSNLDSPDEMDTLQIVHTGTEPFGRFSWSRRVVPSDSPRTELHVREAYYGFGRIDFAHAQRFTPKVEAEASGRLNWYDGMRLNISKARLYNLRGSLTYDLSDAWKANLEYGGANSDVQSPHTITIDSSTGAKTRISVYDEREYGTLRFTKKAERHGFDLGVHLRQDREIHDNYFRLREQLWYGFAKASITRGPWSGSAKLDYEHADMDFPGSMESSKSFGTYLALQHNSSIGKAGFATALRHTPDSNDEDLFRAKAVAANYEAPRIGGFAFYLSGTAARVEIPSLWRNSIYALQFRPQLVSEPFSVLDRTYGGILSGFEVHSPRTVSATSLSPSLNWSRGTSEFAVGCTRYSIETVDYTSRSDSVFLDGDDVSYRNHTGLDGTANFTLAPFLRLQSWSFVHLDNSDLARAIDTRSYSRLLFEKDFLKAPLHISSFVAYEYIGRHDAASDLGSETLGPAHLMHVQVAATIHGVTLLWGVDNLTGQHYYYLPGYPMIAKEEYFGLKWTLTL